MAPGFTDVEAELKRRQSQDGGQGPNPMAVLAQQARASHMVALRMEELLSDEAWNIYLAHLKALQEGDEAEAARWREQMEQPGQTGEQLGMIQQQLQRVLGRLERGRQAMELPTTLVSRDESFQAAAEKLLDTTSPAMVTPSGE